MGVGILIHAVEGTTCKNSSRLRYLFNAVVMPKVQHHEAVTNTWKDVRKALREQREKERRAYIANQKEMRNKLYSGITESLAKLKKERKPRFHINQKVMVKKNNTGKWLEA